MYKNNSREPQPNHLEILKNNSEIDSNHKFVKTQTEQQLAFILSNFLQYGVLIANVVVLWGGILYLIEHGSETAQYQIFQGTSAELRSPISIINTVLSGSSTGIIQLGLLILVAIPVLRVIISFLTFLWTREFVYVIITALVLCSLGYGLIGAY
ncbi:DUF1634 domain-containing protein [Okeanomitos corallinicola TIOX110]|uniref:DUF1634 domain-containing protein n=1 Tax=Okeanomitos corallinicola TIOX110 TaxID=3133117 RepID=A0ABZ2UQT7_9CYAN